MNTNIENCNTELLNLQKEQLKNEIVYGENAGYFAVFDIEAGCRKTRTAEESLVEAYKRGYKSILVRRSDNDCRESMKIINTIAKKDISLAYNNEDITLDNKRKINEILHEIPIVIITHQKYKVLMRDTSKQKMFSKGRRNLVIDEFITAIDTISLSENDISAYRELFKYDSVVLQSFEKAMSQPIDFLKTWNSKNSTRRFVAMTDRHPVKDFNELVKLIQANIDDDGLYEWKNRMQENPPDNLNFITTRKILCEQFNKYKQLFTSMCLYSDKKLYTTDKRSKYWFLSNNIMLDASGELQSAYSLNQEEFSLQHCEKVLDHSKWKIINIPVNTTTSGKEKIMNFYEVINKIINKYGNDILVIGKKDEMSMINVPEGNKGYFGNVTGSNQWYDKKNVAIIQTHNLNDVDYILKYLHYGKKRIDEQFDLSSKSSGRKERKLYSFNDERLEEIRVKWIASEIYQAVKRVNRNMVYNTDILIFINNEQVIELLQKQMNKCSVEIIDFDTNTFEFEKSRQDNYLEELQKESYASKFIDFLAETQNGLHEDFIDSQKRISKVKIREYLGIKTSGNFSNKVLNKSEVVLYCRVRNIDISGQYIRLPQT